MIQIVIDGKYRVVEEGLTLLEAAKVCGVEIPSLCGANKTDEKSPVTFVWLKLRAAA
ncbi:NAD-dependent formate dehydrogenase alpha subunit [Vibrio astriarenae]|nr:NAD-dependent formate dehydrogenase alpha subunit [Vibrio sp. C7]